MCSKLQTLKMYQILNQTSTFATQPNYNKRAKHRLSLGSISWDSCPRRLSSSTMISTAEYAKVSSTLFHFLEIVNRPLECTNSQCGSLFCTFCLKSTNVDSCKVCQNIDGFRNPSPIVIRFLNQYVIQCETCKKPFQIKDLNNHQLLC